MEPAAMLIRALQVEVSGKLQLLRMRSLQHGLLRRARIEPDIERVLHLFVLHEVYVYLSGYAPSGRGPLGACSILVQLGPGPTAGPGTQSGGGASAMALQGTPPPPKR